MLCCHPTLIGKRRKDFFFLTTHSMVVWRWTRRWPERKHAVATTYVPSHRQVSTYYDLCYTSCGALAAMRNSSTCLPRKIDPTTHRTTSGHSSIALYQIDWRKAESLLLLLLETKKINIRKLGKDLTCINVCIIRTSPHPNIKYLRRVVLKYFVAV